MLFQVVNTAKLPISVSFFKQIKIESNHPKGWWVGKDNQRSVCISVKSKTV